MITKEELIEFEEEIAQLFLDKKIRSPIHLSKGNEDQLIQLFKELGIQEHDWVVSTHRSHYHALLKGIPAEWLKQEILENRSIHINNAEYNFISSAIVAGGCPIAVGLALGIKLREENPPERVYCFIGDMAEKTGLYQESMKWAGFKNLPITWIIEDNGFSTNTPTREVWGGDVYRTDNIKRYKYEREYPHVGVGRWVTF
ncbi:hypothetical protein LCGC14_1282460 [marine sediment metagenome]|uniref:Dehydrogenase E1 component domain-containing protein n=1 Tax=marine sediment metagenome TaxID=412755 RepID=A0A0F9NBD0_9ZZZZ